MAIRLSGIVSGLDTEGIVKELMKAQSAKKTKIDNKITKHEWKQEKWKDLNSKIYSLYTGKLSKIRTQGAFLAKSTSSSDTSKVTATAATNAVNGSHSVRVDQLASAQYVTGSKLGNVLNKDGESVAVSGNTTLEQLGFSTSASNETMINIKTAKKEVSLAVTDQTTVNDFVNACKDAGLNASYDTAQKRFFIAAAGSGVENAFSITTDTLGDTAEKNDVRSLLGYADANASNRRAMDAALATYKDVNSTSEEQDEAREKLAKYAMDKANAQLIQDYKDGNVASQASALAQVKIDAETEYKNGLKDGESVDAEAMQKAVDAAVAKAAEEYAKSEREDFEAGTASAGNAFFDADAELDTKLTAYENVSTAGTPIAGNSLDKLGLGEVSFTDNGDGTLTYSTTGSVSLKEAADSIVEYNGAMLTGSSNTITANGLTLNLVGVTKGTANEYISINVSKDSKAVYDMVKDFIKEYNEVLEELNKVYTAPSAREYNPLTDEEREAMTDDQIEKWETKIKDSLLRNDATVSGISSAMKMAMQTTATYDGKTYSLASLGIRTLDYTEFGKLHILGDEDDPLGMSQQDKLMAAIEEDPDKVMEIMTQITGKLYESMGDKMKASSLSSALTFYNDKELTKELKNYKSDLKDMESRLKDMEDRYYKQFTAMEKSMASMQSQQNSLASMLGG